MGMICEKVGLKLQVKKIKYDRRERRFNRRNKRDGRGKWNLQALDKIDGVKTGSWFQRHDESYRHRSDRIFVKTMMCFIDIH